MNGAIYAIGTAAVIAGEPLVGLRTLAHIMPPERSLDIDTEADFTLAETAVASGSMA